MEIVNICTINFLNNTIQCIPEKGCCATNPPENVWESWYVWFGVALLFLFLFTSIATYLGSLCKKKQQNLIRIRNLSPATEHSPVISTISGPGGIIQPDVRFFSHRRPLGSHRTPEPSNERDRENRFADPLSPPYPSVEPVKIVRGSAPTEGFRQTDSYTEIVLPPGYIDPHHHKP